MGLNNSAIIDTTCEVYIYTKQIKHISCKSMKNAKQKLGQVYINLSGPAPNISLHKIKYMPTMKNQLINNSTLSESQIKRMFLYISAVRLLILNLKVDLLLGLFILI